MKELIVRRVKNIKGSFRPASDKSLTHRSYMFAAIASGASVIRNPLRGEDCESTLRCLGQMGLNHEWINPSEVRLLPAKDWLAPSADLDCGNSGTTMRLISGLIASRPISARLIGDSSLSKRPMKRIAAPLTQMGAIVEGDTPPLVIRGSKLNGIDYISPVASAQIKSCTLLAGLRAEGKTSVLEPSVSRDHTERMLIAMGADLQIEGPKVTVSPTEQLNPFEFTVPGDISSAAFFLVAGAILAGSQLEVTDLSVNPTRTGILEVFTQAGIPFELTNNRSELGEPVADLQMSVNSPGSAFVIEGDMVPRLVDEIPVLAVFATQCQGQTVIRDAKELKVKESDRIALVADGLKRMGASVEATEDGFIITGPTPLRGTTIEAHGDHRIAMAFAVAGLVAEGETRILGAESIATSFPGFERQLSHLCQL